MKNFFRLSLLSILLPGIASADIINVNPPSIGAGFASGGIGPIITNAFNLAIVVAGISFMVLLLIGGLQYLFSFGHEEAVTRSRQVMLNAAIGLVIVASSWAVGNFVLTLLGIRLTF